MSEDTKFSLARFQRGVEKLRSYIANCDEFVNWDEKGPPPKGSPPKIAEAAELVFKLLEDFDSDVDEAAIGRLADKPPCTDKACGDRALAFKTFFHKSKTLTMEVANAQVAIHNIVGWQGGLDSKPEVEEDAADRDRDFEQIRELRSKNHEQVIEIHELKSELNELKKQKSKPAESAQRYSNTPATATKNLARSWRAANMFALLASSEGEPSQTSSASMASSTSEERTSPKPSSPQTADPTPTEESPQRDAAVDDSASEDNFKRQDSTGNKSVAQGLALDEELAEGQQSIRTEKTHSTASTYNQSAWGSFPGVGVAQRKLWKEECAGATFRDRDGSAHGDSDRTNSLTARSVTSGSFKRQSIVVQQSAADAGLFEGSLHSTSDDSEKDASSRAASVVRDSRVNQPIPPEGDLNAPVNTLGSALSGNNRDSGISAFNAWDIASDPDSPQSNNSSDLKSGNGNDQSPTSGSKKSAGARAAPTSPRGSVLDRSSSNFSRESSFSAASPVRQLRVVNVEPSESGSDSRGSPVKQPLHEVNAGASDASGDSRGSHLRQRPRVVNDDPSESGSDTRGSPVKQLLRAVNRFPSLIASDSIGSPVKPPHAADDGASASGSDARGSPVKQPLHVANADASESGSDSRGSPVRQPLHVVNDDASDRSSSMAEGSILSAPNESDDSDNYDSPFMEAEQDTDWDRQGKEPRERRTLQVVRLLRDIKLLRAENEALNEYNEELERRISELRAKEQHFRDLIRTPGFGRIFYGEDIFVENGKEYQPRQPTPAAPPQGGTGNRRGGQEWVEEHEEYEELEEQLDDDDEETVRGDDITAGRGTNAIMRRPRSPVGGMGRRRRLVARPQRKARSWTKSLGQSLAKALQVISSILLLRSPWARPPLMPSNASRARERRRFEWGLNPVSASTLLIGIPTLVYTVMTLAAVQRERDLWMEANSLTRRYLLDHARDDTAWWLFLGVDVDFLLRPSTMYYWLLSLWQTSLVWLGYAWVAFGGQATAARAHSRELLLFGPAMP